MGDAIRVVGLRSEPCIQAVLADAPSRAPWECALARHLPLGDAPVRQLIRDLYRHPEKIDEQIERVIEQLDLPIFESLEHVPIQRRNISTLYKGWM